MMAQACYNPAEAVDFWGRMQRAGEMEPPQFLSTHPSSQNRQQKLQEWSVYATF
jgi:metalloendopeptidase OMA1, mitochondrial